jgi:thiol-disulfide isomerase/thioredoxin
VLLSCFLGFTVREKLFRLVARNADGELGEIREEWRQSVEAKYEARKAAKTPQEQDEATDQFSIKEQRLVNRCLAYAKKHTGTADELRALKMIACRVPNSEEGAQATETLVKQAATADFALLEAAIHFSVGVSDDHLKPLGPVLLDRVRRAPDQPQAALLLASVVCPLCAVGENTTTPPPDFAAAADLIMERYAESPDIHNFCEILGMHVGRPLWAGHFEKHLRTILARNHDRKVRVAASFALASVVQQAGESRQAEAEKLYQEFVDQFDGRVRYTEDGKWYGYFGIEQDLNQAAKGQLDELRSRALGKPAPEIDGPDLDGHPMKLSEYRGKVVLLSFWATWCAPCMRLVPSEKMLANRLEGKPFVIIGVNSDTEQHEAQTAVKEHDITWRSFRDEIRHQRAISVDWKVIGYPTFYLIDQKGIIRKRWIGGPTWDDMNEAIDRLLVTR